MKKILFLLVLCTTFLSAQDTTRSGDLRLALNTNLVGNSLLYADMNPSVTYFLSPNWSIGGQISYRKNGGEESRALMDLYSQFYVTNYIFIQPGILTDFHGNNGLSGVLGYTSWLGSRFYIEPAYRLEMVSNNYKGNLILGCGLKL